MRGIRLLVAGAALCLVWGGPLAAASLADEVARLLENHPRLKAARHDIAAAVEGIDSAYGAYLPSIDMVAGYGYEYTDSPALRGSRISPLNTQSKSFSLTLTENIFTGFGSVADNEAARLNREIAVIALNALREEILFDAVSAYLDILRYSALLGLAVSGERNVEQQIELESERGRRGGGIYLEVLRLESRLQVARERRVDFEGNLRDAVTRYSQLFDGAPRVADMTLPQAPLALLPAAVEAAEQIALTENPIVADSARNVDLTRTDKKLAQSPYYPILDFVGKYNYERDNKGAVGMRRDYSAKLEARWNLFSGFSTRADVAAATFRESAASEGRDFVNRRVIEEVRLSWDGLSTLRDRAALLEKAVDIASMFYEARDKRRLAGGGETLVTLLDAANDVLAAEIGATGAGFDTRIATYRLLFSIGRMTPAFVVH